MEYREFISLTDAEIMQIVKDIFLTNKVTCIKRHKRDDYISCKIYTEWSSEDDNGNQIIETIPDVIELRDPFQYSSKAIHADFPLMASDYRTLKQFCFAKGIVPSWVKDNPYVEKEEGKTKGE